MGVNNVVYIFRGQTAGSKALGDIWRGCQRLPAFDMLLNGHGIAIFIPT